MLLDEDCSKHIKIHSIWIRTLKSSVPNLIFNDCVQLSKRVDINERQEGSEAFPYVKILAIDPNLITIKSLNDLYLTNLK